MRESLAQVAGIDVSKDYLDVHLHPSGATQRVTNDKAGHKALLRWFSRVIPVQGIPDAMRYG
jgi:transposase